MQAIRPKQALAIVLQRLERIICITKSLLILFGERVNQGIFCEYFFKT